MDDLASQLETAIRSHERLKISLGQRRDQLDRKTHVSRIMGEKRQQEIEALRKSIASIERNLQKAAERVNALREQLQEAING